MKIISAIVVLLSATGNAFGDSRRGRESIGHRAILQDSATCVDVPGWYDSDGETYDCLWYSVGSRCSHFGQYYENFGRTANDSCCACGGGMYEQERDGLRVTNVSFSDSFFMIWQDRGSGGSYDVGLWRPALPPLHFVVGFVAVQGYGKPNLDNLVNAHYSTPPTSAMAADSFQYVYRDSGTGSRLDLSIARPVCPEGYFSLSDVPLMGHCYNDQGCTIMANEQYPPKVYRPCINSSLLKQCGSLPQNMWNDIGTGGDIDQSFTGINTGGMAKLGNGDGQSYQPCFFRSTYGHTGRITDPDLSKCLDGDKLVDIDFTPSNLLDEQLALKFAPQLRFDRDTQDYPISAADFYEGAMKQNPGITFKNIKDIDRIRMYYFIDRCESGSTIRIVYLWFFGFQPTCAGDLAGDSQHHADWEKIEVVIEANADSARPLKKVTYHQHGDYYTANKVPIVEESDGVHPVVYVGRDSHGSYHFESNDTPGIGDIITCLHFDDPRRPGTYYNSWERPSQFTNIEDPQEEEREWVEADIAGTFSKWTVMGDQSIDGISTHPVKELLDATYHKYDGSCPEKTCTKQSCDWEVYFQCKDGITAESFFDDVENVFRCEGNGWEQIYGKVTEEGEDWLIGMYDKASDFFNNEFLEALDAFGSWFGDAGDAFCNLFRC